MKCFTNGFIQFEKTEIRGLITAVGLFLFIFLTTPGIFAQEATLIQVVDVSASTERTQKYKGQITRAIFEACPTGVPQVGITMGSRVEKTLLTQASIPEFIASLSTVSKEQRAWTDLEFGFQSAVAALRETNTRRGLIVIQSDGELSLPQPIGGQRLPLVDLLLKYFGNLSNIRVIVIDVGGRRIGNVGRLPAHITVISLQDWRQALNAVNDTVAPEIRSLATQPTVNRPTAPTEAASPLPKWPFWGGGILLLGLVALYLARRKPLPDHPDMIRPEDTRKTEEPTTVLVEVRSGNQLVAGPKPIGNEPLFIGNGAPSDLRIPNLRQNQALGLTIEKDQIFGFRTRPSNSDLDLDEIALNGRKTTSTTHFKVHESDVITLNGTVQVVLSRVPLESLKSFRQSTAPTAQRRRNPRS